MSFRPSNAHFLQYTAIRSASRPEYHVNHSYPGLLVSRPREQVLDNLEGYEGWLSGVRYQEDTDHAARRR